MKKIVELPLIEPLYSTYQYQGPTSAIIKDNPTVRNWFLNQVMILSCNRMFLTGFTTPEIEVKDASWEECPHLEKIGFSMRFLKGYINPIIRQFLDYGYYVCFDGVDDYYVEGKSWYKKNHFDHDGMICGYDQTNKTYCIYAYDSNWIYRKFWTPQKSFNDGRKAIMKKGQYGSLCGIKVKPDKVEFSPETTYKNLLEYLDSTFEKYPIDGDGKVYGIIVHDYIAKYIGKLFDGTIPYERMDRRIFRQIWEHKKVMQERIAVLEKTLNLNSSCSEQYQSIVSLANMLRMLYASHHMKRRDSILPVLQQKILLLRQTEEELLHDFMNTIGGKIEK